MSLKRKPIAGERIYFTATDMYPQCSGEPYIVLGERYPAYQGDTILAIKQKGKEPSCFIYKFVEGYNKSWSIIDE